MQNRDAPLSLHLHVIHVYIFDGIKNMHLMPKKASLELTPVISYQFLGHKQVSLPHVPVSFLLLLASFGGMHSHTWVLG